MTYVVDDKSKEDFNHIRDICKGWLKKDFFRLAREWQYKNIIRRIVIEKKLEDEKGNIPADIKFHCFDGKVEFKCSFVVEWRSKEDEKEFYKFVEENELDNRIEYLGKRTDDDKEKVLKKSDVLIFPTEYPFETFGRVIIEVMMYGIPVIANGIATISSIIDHYKTGFVLKENTPKEIAGYVIKLNDYKVGEKMGIAGRKRFLKRYELKNFEREFKKIILKGFSSN